MAVAFWGVLWSLGFPPTYRDDLFFVGPGLELAQHGRLANPLLRFWNPVAAERYFFHAPFHPHVTAGWVAVFGVSSASLRAMQCFLGAVSSMAIMELLGRRGFRGTIFVPLLVAIALLDSGLRHDALGLALLSAGILLCDRPSPLRRGIGLVLVGCGMLTWPILLGFGLPLLTALALGEAGATPWRAVVRNWLLPAIPAAAATLLSFVVLVDGRLMTYIRDYLWHVDVARGYPLPWLLRHLFTHGYAELTVIPVFLLFLILGAIVCQQEGQNGLRARRLFLVLGASVVLSILIYAKSLLVTGTLACWIAVVCFLGEVKPRRRAAILALLAVGVFGLSHGYLAVRLLGTDWEARGAAAAATVPIPKGFRIGVDAESARFVYDYRLPPEAFLYHYGAPPGTNWPPTWDALPSKVILIVSTESRDMVEGSTRRDFVRFSGRPFPSLPRTPHEIVVLRR